MPTAVLLIVDRGIHVAVKGVAKVFPILKTGKQRQAVQILHRGLALAREHIQDSLQRRAAQVNVMLGQHRRKMIEIYCQLMWLLLHLFSRFHQKKSQVSFHFDNDVSLQIFDAKLQINSHADKDYSL